MELYSQNFLKHLLKQTNNPGNPLLPYPNDAGIVNLARSPMESCRYNEKIKVKHQGLENKMNADPIIGHRSCSSEYLNLRYSQIKARYHLFTTYMVRMMV